MLQIMSLGVRMVLHWLRSHRPLRNCNSINYSLFFFYFKFSFERILIVYIYWLPCTFLLCLARSARWLWVFCGLDWVRLARIGDMSTRWDSSLDVFLQYLEDYSFGVTWVFFVVYRHCRLLIIWFQTDLNEQLMRLLSILTKYLSVYFFSYTFISRFPVVEPCGFLLTWSLFVILLLM